MNIWLNVWTYLPKIISELNIRSETVNNCFMIRKKESPASISSISSASFGVWNQAGKINMSVTVCCTDIRSKTSIHSSTFIQWQLTIIMYLLALIPVTEQLAFSCNSGWSIHFSQCINILVHVGSFSIYVFQFNLVFPKAHNLKYFIKWNKINGLKYNFVSFIVVTLFTPVKSNAIQHNLSSAKFYL